MDGFGNNNAGQVVEEIVNDPNGNYQIIRKIIAGEEYVITVKILNQLAPFTVDIMAFNAAHHAHKLLAFSANTLQVGVDTPGTNHTVSVYNMLTNDANDSLNTPFVGNLINGYIYIDSTSGLQAYDTGGRVCLLAADKLPTFTYTPPTDEQSSDNISSYTFKGFYQLK